MKRATLWVSWVCLLGGLSASAQLAYYIDEKGRRVYVNADVPKSASKQRSSVLLKAPRHKVAKIKIPAQPALEARSARPVVEMPWPNLDSLIQKTAERHHLDPDLVRTIIQVESNFNPFAVSHKGAMGLMQLVPGTAQRFGVSNIFDPVENLEGGVRYLKYLLSNYSGDLRLSLAAYNAGEKAVERHGGVPPYRETRQYVQRISTLYGNGLTLVSGASRNHPGIVKYLDENGRWHFTNTELP